MEKRWGVIFDMDGTLWDSTIPVAQSWTEVVQREYQKDRVIGRRDMERVMGKPMDLLAEALFPELPERKRMELMEKCCLEENEYLRRNGGTLYPLVGETLLLLQREYPLFIVSNCQSGYIEAFLEYYHFGAYFSDTECYGNNQRQKGENISRVMGRNRLDKAVYVGDIQSDYDSSVEAGALFIHAAYGFGTIAENVPAITAFSQLPQLLKTLIGK